jgi:NAD(P)-dependent dehydrogenase (short-subunit alcohol dehydrogenase family)
VVTGAGGSGCGRAISVRLGRNGVAVVAADVDEAGGRESVRQVEAAGGAAVFIRADVRDAGDVQRMVDAAESTFGGLDLLINNASAPHGDASLDSWIDTLQTDLLGALSATKTSIAAMRRRGGGAVVNVSSISALWHGRKTPGGIAGYDVAKAGMIRMTTRLASLAETDNIRVNCLAPGWIGTEHVRVYWESLTPSQRLERSVPARLLTPEQVADMVVRIADDRTLAGRIVVWWSEDEPRLVEWGDRGYRNGTAYQLS